MYLNAPPAWRKRPNPQPGDGADFSEQPRNKLVKHVRHGDSLLMEMDIDRAPPSPGSSFVFPTPSRSKLIEHYLPIADPPPLTSTTTEGITFEPSGKFTRNWTPYTVLSLTDVEIMDGYQDRERPNSSYDICLGMVRE
jgi:hypothetical protein